MKERLNPIDFQEALRMTNTEINRARTFLSDALSILQYTVINSEDERLDKLMGEFDDDIISDLIDIRSRIGRYTDKLRELEEDIKK